MSHKNLIGQLRGWQEARIDLAVKRVTAAAADAIEELEGQIALRDQSDSHERCDAEISRLRTALESAVHWARGMEEAPADERPKWFDMARNCLSSSADGNGR